MGPFYSPEGRAHRWLSFYRLVGLDDDPPYVGNIHSYMDCDQNHHFQGNFADYRIYRLPDNPHPYAKNQCPKKTVVDGAPVHMAFSAALGKLLATKDL